MLDRKQTGAFQNPYGVKDYKSKKNSSNDLSMTSTTTAIGDKGKKEFFKLVVLSVIMNQPSFML